MKTIFFKFKITPEIQNAISEDSRVCSAMRRFAFNRFVDGIKQQAIYQLINEKFHNINSHLKNSALRSANGLFTSWKTQKQEKLYFGQFKRFQRGIISKEEFKNSKNTGIISEGEAVQRGNRFIKIDIENNKIIWKRSAKEHYDLILIENLSEKRKQFLSKLQLLMLEKKIPVTVKIKNDIIYLTYDETIVEKEKQFKIFQIKLLT